MNTPLTPEQKAERIKTAARVVALGIICFFIAPFTILALKGLLGIIAFTMIAAPVYFMLPFFGKLLANWRLQAYKAQAASNPIPTLQNQLIEKKQALDEALKSIAQLIASYKTYLSQIKAGGLSRPPAFL